MNANSITIIINHLNEARAYAVGAGLDHHFISEIDHLLKTAKTKMDETKVRVHKVDLISELNEACEKAGLDQTWFDETDVHEDNALGFTVEMIVLTEDERNKLTDVLKSVSARHGVPFPSRRSSLDVNECKSEVSGSTYWDFDWTFLPNENRIIVKSAQARFDEELAAKNAEIAQLKEERNRLVVNTFIKNCTAHNCSAWERIALLERALKPVSECNTMDAAFCLDNALWAVRKAQLIISEGEKPVRRDCINWSGNDHCAKFKCNHCPSDFCKYYKKLIQAE